MSDAITEISNAMNADLKRLQAIAQNISNANTQGFKALQLVPVDDGSGTTGNIPGADKLKPHVTAGDGPLNSTGRTLDFALSGSGFFAVMTPDGIGYQRDGSLVVDSEGRLVTGRGYPVLGESGEITITGSDVQVDLEGDIKVDGMLVDRFRLIAPGNGIEIHKQDNGSYRFAGGQAASDTIVHQGMLEASNVDITAEMVRLMETTRHMESVQRAMRMYDQMLDTGINQIGKGR